MAFKIAQLGQPVLRKKTRAVDPAEIKSTSFQSFLTEMIDTLRVAGGVGLAAPQVFDSRRVFLAAVLPPINPGERAGVEVLINPVFSDLSSEKVSAWEGCLSYLELLVLVPRHRSLRVDFIDREGNQRAFELSGYPARIVQHEFDHLEGILTIDRAATSHDIIKATELDDVMDSRRPKDSKDEVE